MESKTPVILIGGAPGAGKTTLGRALAARLGFASTTVDDLHTAAQVLTTIESHPELHIMRRVPHTQYFTEGPLEKLIADADLQHQAVFPIVKKTIEKHVRNRSGIVLDGWFLRPSLVAPLASEEVRAFFIHCEPTVLTGREEANRGWLEGSTDEDRMLRNFIDRSLWFNELVQREAEEHDLPILEQPGGRTVSELCDDVLQALSNPDHSPR